MTSRSLAGGKIATAWSYLDNEGDRRLKSIVNSFGREFDYTTTPDNLITAIAEQRSGKLLRRWSLGYDADNWLTRADESPGGQYAYALDPVGNIVKSGSTTLIYNKVNELANAGYVYDADGELVSDGVRRYAWDAQHRLIGVTQGGVRSGFAYDGLDRRVTMATTQDGRTTTTDYVWCGPRPCQSRNGASSVTRLYYGEGEVVAPQAEKLFYGPDQLGSVRDMDVISATVSAPGREYDYDPYGNPIATPSGVPLTDFRYAGTFYPGNGSAEGGLGLTQYRAYDPRVARWLTHDPLGELSGTQASGFSQPVMNSGLAPGGATMPAAGTIPYTIRSNLYAYSNDDPVDNVDPVGLWTLQLGIGGSGAVPVIGPFGISGWGGVGIVWDTCGHVGFFWTFGLGVGAGASGGGGPILDVTNARTINDLNGLSGNVNVRVGPVNVNGQIGNYSNGQHYYGGSVIPGPGAGASGAVGGSYTGIIPLL